MSRPGAELSGAIALLLVLVHGAFQPARCGVDRSSLSNSRMAFHPLGIPSDLNVPSSTAKSQYGTPRLPHLTWRCLHEMLDGKFGETPSLWRSWGWGSWGRGRLPPPDAAVGQHALELHGRSDCPIAVAADVFDGHSFTGHFFDAGPGGISNSTSRLESKNVPVLTGLAHYTLKVFNAYGKQYFREIGSRGCD